jgi:hypothetical protein
MNKIKISQAWNRSFTQRNVKEARTDLDLGDMLKISEKNQINQLDDTIERLEKLIAYKKQEKQNIQDKYKKIRNKIAHDPSVQMVEGVDRRNFSDNLSGLEIRKTTLGCSIDQFRIFCEVQFENGMTWDNWTNRNRENAWNMDHIQEKQSGGSNHWSNFVPRDRKENLNKGKLESALNHYASK